MTLDLGFVSTPGSARGSGGEGAFAEGAGDGAGGVEAEGPGPHCRAAGEGGSDRLPQAGAAQLSERCAGNAMKSSHSETRNKTSSQTVVCK